MNINSVVFPQKLLISQGQVSLRWFIKTNIWAYLYWVALQQVTESAVEGVTKIPEWNKGKNAEEPQMLWCNGFPAFWAWSQDS